MMDDANLSTCETSVSYFLYKLMQFYKCEEYDKFFTRNFYIKETQI